MLVSQHVPNGARPGTVKVLFRFIRFISDDGQRHHGIDARHDQERRGWRVYVTLFRKLFTAF